MTQQTTPDYTRNRIVAMLILMALVGTGVWIYNMPPDRTDAEIAYEAAVFDVHHTLGLPVDQLLAAGHQVCDDMTKFDGNVPLAKFRLMNTYGTDLVQTNLVFDAATTTLCPVSSAGGALPGSTPDPNR